MEKIKRVGAILLVISLIIITGSVREKMTAKDEPNLERSDTITKLNEVWAEVSTERFLF